MEEKIMEHKDLAEIHQSLKPLLQAYEKKGFVAKVDADGKYDLWSVKDVEAFGKKRKEIYLGGLHIKSNYVGFYLLSLYADPDITKEIGKELLATLKGKSCFHIKKTDPTLTKQIKEALALSYKMYKEKGRV